MAPTPFFCAVFLLAAFATAAPPLFASEKDQLTEAKVAALNQAGCSLFDFGSSHPASSVNTTRRCKVYPGDSEWPSDDKWALLDTVTGGRLLTKPVPQAAVCYDGPHYNGAECAKLSANWTNSYIHLADPIEMMSPVYQGLTCSPPSLYDTKGCTQGGFPWYVINATTPKHIQAGVNFARNTGVRLVVKNTGHDFSGKSGGGGSLSIWTHYFKDIEYIEEYVDDVEGYSGPAFKCGTGVQAFEINKAAAAKGRIVVGGEGQVSFSPADIR